MVTAKRFWRISNVMVNTNPYNPITYLKIRIWWSRTRMSVVVAYSEVWYAETNQAFQIVKACVWIYEWLKNANQTSWLKKVLFKYNFGSACSARFVIIVCVQYWNFDFIMWEIFWCSKWKLKKTMRQESILKSIYLTRFGSSDIYVETILKWNLNVKWGYYLVSHNCVLQIRDAMN